MFVAAVSNCSVFACWVCAVCRSAVHWLRSDLNFIFLFYICSPLHFTWIRCVFLRAAKVHPNTLYNINSMVLVQLIKWTLRVKKRHTKAKKKNTLREKLKNVAQNAREAENLTTHWRVESRRMHSSVSSWKLETLHANDHRRERIPYRYRSSFSRRCSKWKKNSL